MKHTHDWLIRAPSLITVYIIQGAALCLVISYTVNTTAAYFNVLQSLTVLVCCPQSQGGEGGPLAGIDALESWTPDKRIQHMALDDARVSLLLPGEANVQYNHIRPCINQPIEIRVSTVSMLTY